MEAPAIDRVGQTIAGRYRLLRRVAEGGVGSVYEAEQSLGSSSRAVAIKLLRPEWSNDASVKARFHREAALVALLQHPNTVRIYDFGTTEDGALFIAMEFLRGRSLQQLLDEQGAQPPSRVQRILGQVAASLQEAHDLGVVHRDLKPDNILIEARASGAPLARVIDFGIAKLSEDLSESGLKAPKPSQPLTKEGAIIGTPGYMAPEQALARPASHAADIYSLGVVLWEAIVGAPLWRGDTIQAILQAQLKLTPPTIRSANPHAQVPAALDELVLRMISRRPEERPASALEVKNQLRKLLRGNAAAAAAPRSSAARQIWVVLFSMLAAGTVLGSMIALTPSDAPSTGSAELDASIQALLEGSAAAREAAAQRLAASGQRGAVPPFARELARLELGRNCTEKRAALQSALKLGDPRVTPALKRLSQEPATGCGARKDQDCLACLRNDLRASLRPGG